VKRFLKKNFNKLKEKIIWKVMSTLDREIFYAIILIRCFIGLADS